MHKTLSLGYTRAETEDCKKNLFYFASQKRGLYTRGLYTSGITVVEGSETWATLRYPPQLFRWDKKGITVVLLAFGRTWSLSVVLKVGSPPSLMSVYSWSFRRLGRTPPMLCFS